MSPYKDPVKDKAYHKEYSKKYHEDNRLKINEQHRKWTKEDRQKNPEKYRRYGKLAWQKLLLNPEKRHKRQRKSYWKNRDHIQEYAKQYYSTEDQKIKRSQQSKEYELLNYQKRQKQKAENNKAYKKIVVEYYSNGTMKCNRCGIFDIRVLSVDHIDGKGNKYRQETGSSSYRWLLHHNFPEGYQVLCMSCQFVKAREKEEFGKIRSMTKRNIYERQRRLSRRLQVLKHYSNGVLKCVKCGSEIVEALTVDHISGNNQQTPRSGDPLIRWIIKHNFPENMFQTLCVNCQWIKRVENKELIGKRKKKVLPNNTPHKKGSSENNEGC